MQELPKFGECWVDDQIVPQWESKGRVVAGPIEIVKDGPTLVRVCLAAGGWLSYATEVPEQGRPCHLKLGQTAHFFFQFRAQGHEDAWFERQIANVGWLPKFDPEVFRLRPFDHEFKHWSATAP